MWAVIVFDLLSEGDKWGSFRTHSLNKSVWTIQSLHRNFLARFFSYFSLFAASPQKKQWILKTNLLIIALLIFGLFFHSSNSKHSECNFTLSQKSTVCLEQISKRNYCDQSCKNLSSINESIILSPWSL